MSKIFILGSGPAGLTAALYTARANIDTTIFSGPQPGGQLTTTTVIENFPGFPEGIDGSVLIEKMQQQVKQFSAKILAKEITKVDFSGTIKKLWSKDALFEADAIIIATGARSKMLDLPREQELFAKGIHTCATCDGFFYKDKIIAILGGGDSAMEESLFLTNFAKKVYLIHRRHEFRASPIMQERVLNNPKIEIIWDTEIKEYLGQDQLEGVTIKNLITNEEKKLEISAIFMAIGHLPNTDFLTGQLDITPAKTIAVKNQVYTSAKGVFAAGDCVDHIYRQAISSAGLGCMAAIAATRFLQSPTTNY